jgi:hypothetical protein
LWKKEEKVSESDDQERNKIKLSKAAKYQRRPKSKRKCTLVISGWAWGTVEILGAWGDDFFINQ